MVVVDASGNLACAGVSVPDVDIVEVYSILVQMELARCLIWNTSVCDLQYGILKS